MCCSHKVLLHPEYFQLTFQAPHPLDKEGIRKKAYCRVSTDSDEQATSYEAQVEHYTDFIKKNPEWEFAGMDCQIPVSAFPL